MAHATGSMLAQDCSMTRNIPAGTTMTGLLLDTKKLPSEKQGSVGSTRVYIKE